MTDGGNEAASVGEGSQPPGYTVDAEGKLVGGYRPSGPTNWGRWGDDDRRGTANLIGPGEVLAAAGLIRKGAVFSLAQPIDPAAPHSVPRPQIKHTFLYTGTDAVTGHGSIPGVSPAFDFTDDAIAMGLQSSTQWDGLAHVGTYGALYNGFWLGTVTAHGSQKLGIEHMRESFVGRGVMLDVARHLGVDSLDPGFGIGPDLLDAVAAGHGVEIRSGDILLLRTGYMSRWPGAATGDQEAFEHAGSPGITGACVAWLHALDVAAVAADNRAVEVTPTIDDPILAPVHRGCLVDLGLTLGEYWSLDALAADCAEDGCWEFMLVAPPLHIPKGVGSPLNPIAIK